MRMEQYLTFTDHALWEVIINGNSVSLVASASAGAECPISPKTAEQKLARKNELKAKSTLRLAIPDEHLLNAAGSTYVNLSGSIPVNVATLPNADLPTNPLMPDLEDITDLQDTGIFSGAYDDKVKGKHAIETKWVYRNKKDERGIVVRNKARMVAQDGCEECLSVWHYRRGGGMQRDDGNLISQEKYVAGILKTFNFSLVKTAITLIETNRALLKDEEAEDVDVYLYRSMIGSLMYLTASRPDIMFGVCALIMLELVLTGNPQPEVFSFLERDCFHSNAYTYYCQLKVSAAKSKFTTVDNQVKGLDRHNEIFVILSHTKKVFANMRRKGKDFSGKKQKSRKKQRKGIEVSSPSSEIPNEEGVPKTSNDPLPS
nr:hypothetical protein [Tanacetum cinerariifolium]